MGCLHNPANVQQTSSKCNAGRFVSGLANVVYRHYCYSKFTDTLQARQDSKNCIAAVFVGCQKFSKKVSCLTIFVQKCKNFGLKIQF